MLIALEPLAVPGGARELRARLDHPRAVRLPRLEHAPPEGPAQRARRAGRAGAARRPARPRGARAPARDRPGARARRARRLAARRGRRAAGRPAGGASTASASARATATLPPSDRIAHLLLALRTDEEGFATVANHAFSGAPWRLRRRIREEQRPRARRGRRGGALRWPGTSSSPAAGSAASTPRAGSSGCCRATARASRVLSDTNFLLYTPLLPGRGGGHARAAPRRRPAARGARLDRHPARPRDSALDPALNELRWCTLDGPRVAHPLRPARRRARLGLAHAADPGAGRARVGLQDDRRGDRAAQPRAAPPRDRRVARRSGGAARVPDLRVRRRRLRGRSRASPSSRTSSPT